jgi:plasmid maintenance system antidote protein VapI
MTFPKDDGYLLAAVGRLLATELRRAGVNQRTLAVLLDVSEARVSKLVNSNGNITIRTLEKIAAALGRRVSVCFVDEDAPADRGPS